MKLRLTALLLAMAMLLSGCASMLQRSYSSSVEHVEYTVTEDSSTLRAETYRGLVDAILYFVNEHAEQGVVRLYNYTTDVDTDLDAACQEVMQEDPLGAFAVESIDCQSARIVSYYEVTVSLTYSHTAQEVDAIQLVTGTSSIRQKLQQAVSAFSSSLVLRSSYFTGGESDVRAMAVQAYYDTAQSAFGMPDISVAVYPDSGAQRIIEVTFRWPESQEKLTERSVDLLVLARQLLGADPPAGESYTPQELTAILQANTSAMDPGGASDPYSALSGADSNQLAHTLALELLFQLAEIDVTLVTGMDSLGDTCWLIVDTDVGYRHLLLTAEEPQLYTDLELTALGYLWNGDLYPDCVDYDADLSGAQSDAETAEPEG